ncbi:MAG: DUF1015 domain-containing protein [Acidobacteriia bacterium]|nr:DUF1015 domain-containing protein [Terriglobia bacterium]
MARIFPFRAFHYDPTRVGVLDKVVTQPYDKISDEMRERYYASSPFNLARIVRGMQHPTDTEAENVYTRAQKLLREWIKSGILRQEDQPALFAYFQEYELPAVPGKRLTRKGFIGIGKLGDYSSGVVFPHEQTLSGPKEDRLKLLRLTRAHFGQIFMLYADPDRAVDAFLEEAALTAPDIRVTDEYGVVHSVWKITDPPRISRIQQELEDKRLIIADGHHRYETALTFRDECRTLQSGTAGPAAPGDLPPYEKVMMTFVNMESEGLTILPTHRLVSNLPYFEMKDFLTRVQWFFDLAGFKFFTPEERERKLEQFRRELHEVGQVIPSIGLRVAGTSNFYLMKLKGTLNLQQLLPDVPERQHKLDVVILHKIVLERCLGISEEDIRSERYVRYIREFEGGLQAVERKESQLAFFLNPTPIAQVRDLAFAGERLPQKSTDFYPKLLSGLTMYQLDSTDPAK